MLIDETKLSKFRREHLSAPAILRLLVDQMQVSLRLPVGVGKSTLVDELLADAKTYEQFDLVLYVAPMKEIVREREEALLSQPSSPPYAVLRARPRSRCGSLDQDWVALERRGCAAHAKDTLCKSCPERVGGNPCDWPTPLKGKVAGKRIVLLTEANLTIDPGFIHRLAQATGSAPERVLVILDEAKLARSSFANVVSVREIVSFVSSLRAADVSAVLDQWMVSLARLQHASQTALQSLSDPFPSDINKQSRQIQAAGLSCSSNDYRYLGHILTMFPYSRGEERWRDDDGKIHFYLRPFLNYRVLALSAGFPAEYLRRRLGLDRLVAPYDHLAVRHSGTKIYNLKNPIGAATFFVKNSPQTLDFFAALIWRNIIAGMTTLLVSRKKFVGFCARYLAQRLLAWGQPVIFVTEDFDRLGVPDPQVIPIINYGLAGVNRFTRYQTCYCLNSYYVAEHIVEDLVQSSDPLHSRIPLKIVTDSNRVRRVSVDPTFRYTHLGIFGDMYLQVIEVDPVIQAAGRARFFTEEREIFLFQMNDLGKGLGSVEELWTLEAAYQAFGLERASHLDRIINGKRVQDLVAQGLSIRAAAARLGLSKSSAHRWVRLLAEVSQPPSLLVERVLGTPDAPEEGSSS